MHRWPRSTHQVAVDAPHNLGRYSTGSFTTVQSWDQAGSICALSRSRSQEKGRTEASDRRAAAAREPYPRRTCREGAHRAPRSYATVRGPRRSMARVGQRSEAAVLSSRPLGRWRCCQKAGQLAPSTCHERGSSVRATAAKRSNGSRTARPVRAEEARGAGMSSHVHVHRPRAPCGRVLLL